MFERNSYTAVVGSSMLHQLVGLPSQSQRVPIMGSRRYTFRFGAPLFCDVGLKEPSVTSHSSQKAEDFDFVKMTDMTAGGALLIL